MPAYVEQPEQVSPQLKDIGLGISLGIKDSAVISNCIIKKNINETAKLKKVEEQPKRGQRCLSREYEGLKKRNRDEGGKATR